jgi:L-ascorbate metabolism protein UlaG (beta-lactamase superfamily)
VIRPGGEVQYGRLSIRAVPAYNLNKFRRPGVPFHPRDKEHVGFICRAEGVTWYFAGDTDAIPEMAQFGPVDYAFLPVSGTYVMTAEEAAEAVRMLQPRVVIPCIMGRSSGRWRTLDVWLRSSVMSRRSGSWSPVVVRAE